MLLQSAAQQTSSAPRSGQNIHTTPLLQTAEATRKPTAGACASCWPAQGVSGHCKILYLKVHGQL